MTLVFAAYNDYINDADVVKLRTIPEKMNREIIEITELALANILDVIPLISNTGERVDPIILRIYERNAAVLDQN